MNFRMFSTIQELSLRRVQHDAARARAHEGILYLRDSCGQRAGEENEVKGVSRHSHFRVTIECFVA